MKIRGRKKQTIQCGIIFLIGILFLIGLNKELSKMTEVEPAAQEVVTTVDDEKKSVVGKKISLQVAAIYSEGQKELSKLQIEKIATYLPGNNYLKQVEVRKEAKPELITLIYRIAENDQTWARLDKEQLALINGCSLISLYDEVDVVHIIIEKDNELYEQYVYRPELETYFGLSLDHIESEETFERLANEFVKQDKVNTYMNSKQAFASDNLGQAVEGYYKTSFPIIQQDEKIQMPIINLQVEKTLQKQYGYKLFIQGLAYNSPSMNYYAAYKLTEYYGSNHLEEILVELAACKEQTKSKAVKKACDDAIDVLSYKEVETPKVFTLFNEAPLYNKPVIYGIIHGELKKIGVWDEEEKARAKVISVSLDNSYALCEIEEGAKKYLYVLPIGGKEICEVKALQVLQQDKIVCKELYTYMLEKLQVYNKAMSKRNDYLQEASWITDSLLKLKVGDIDYIYNSLTKVLKTREEFEQSYGLEEFMQGVKTIEVRDGKKNEVEVIGVYEQRHPNCKLTKVRVAGEHINVYEFDTTVDKEQAIKKKLVKDQYTWQRGRVIIGYNGQARNLLSLIYTVMHT